MTTTQQLTLWMRHDPNFIGVYPLDMLPHLNKPLGWSLIVNTQTKNLPGKHWIAVRTHYDQAWIFDPLGYPPPSELCHHLQMHCFMRIIHVSEVAVQLPNTITCGQHCIYFLYHSLPAPSEKVALDFVKKL